jgi:hypothetical protein
MSGIHTHSGTRAVQRMVEYAPSSGGLALWVHHRDLPEAQGGTVLARICRCDRLLSSTLDKARSS